MQVGIGVSITSNPFRVAVSVSGTLTLDSLTYTRGTAGVAPDLNSTVSSTGTVTGNYTLYWATRSTGTALSKAAIENGTGDALDSGSVTAATLAGLDASLDLSTSLTNGAIDAFIRDSSATPIESAVASVTGVNYDAAAPVFASAEVGTVDATSLIVTFDKAIYGSTSAADWDVQVAGAAATESAAVIDGATVDITLGAAVTSGQTVTVAYNGTGIVGIDAEQSATFLAQSATNNVSGAAPTFADAITDSTNNSGDMAYTLATTTRDTYGWMTTGGAQDEQRIDTAASTDAMSTATQNALIAAGSFVYVCDIRSSATGTNFIPTFQARGLSGTLYQETVSFNTSTGTWGAAPGAFWDRTGFADVSADYGVAAGTVYRIWMSWTQDGSNTRVLHTANDNLHNTDFRRFCIFDRTTFNATGATMDTEIAGMTP